MEPPPVPGVPPPVNNMAVVIPGTAGAATGAVRRVGATTVGARTVGARTVGATTVATVGAATGKRKVTVPIGGGGTKVVILNPAGVTEGAVAVTNGRVGVRVDALR